MQENYSSEKVEFEKLSLGPILETSEDAAATEAAQIYTVWLVNQSDWIFYELETSRGQRVPYPTPIGKNCPGSQDCDSCFNEEKADPIVSSPCTEPPFTVKIHGRKGEQQATLEVNVTPNCDFPGAYGCLSPNA